MFSLLKLLKLNKFIILLKLEVDIYLTNWMRTDSFSLG